MTFVKCLPKLATVHNVIFFEEFDIFERFTKLTVRQPLRLQFIQSREDHARGAALGLVDVQLHIVAHHFLEKLRAQLAQDARARLRCPGFGMDSTPT